MRAKPIVRKKASSIKHANKKFSKMQKRGKMRKKKTVEDGNKNIPSENDKTIDDNHEENEIDVLDMLEEEDLAYLRQTQSSNKFLKSNLESTGATESNNKRKNYDDVENEYEKVPRLGQKIEKEKRPLLPLKSKHGIILQSEAVESSDESDVENGEIDAEANPIESNNDAELSKLSTVQLYVRKQQQLHELKLKMSTLANLVIQDPNNNMRRLKELRLLLDKNIGLIGYKLVLLSLMEVFKDIIPGYKIMTNADDDGQKKKKDTKQLVESEQALLRNYSHYLKRLEQLLRGIRSKVLKSNLNDRMKKSSVILGEVAVMCLCELLSTHPHFNFHKTVISLIVPLMAHKNNKISEKCRDAVRQIYKQDKLGSVSLQIVRHTTRLIKSKNYEVDPSIIDTFLALKLTEANLNADDKKQEILTRKEWYKKFSRRERKFKKKMASLDQELLEAEAEESKQKKSNFQTEIVKLIFLCYFRVLKQSSRSILLSSVLEGLAKFAHLINVDFFDDLIHVLYKHIESGELTYRESLHCVKTVFTILSGQGEALNIDPQKFYSHMYTSSLSLHCGSTGDDVKLLLECVDLLIIQRRKKVSLQRILAFMKRLSSISLQLHHNGAIACLNYVRSLLMTHKSSDILLDTDCSSGSGYYLPELSEPDHCNAKSTSLWELHLLQKHYHPVVSKYSQNITNGAPVQGNVHLPVELLRSNPCNLFDDYDPSEMRFKPAVSTLVRSVGKNKRLPVSHRPIEEQARTLMDSLTSHQPIHIL